MKPPNHKSTIVLNILALSFLLVMAMSLIEKNVFEINFGEENIKTINTKIESIENQERLKSLLHDSVKVINSQEAKFLSLVEVCKYSLYLIAFLIAVNTIELVKIIKEKSILKNKK